MVTEFFVADFFVTLGVWTLTFLLHSTLLLSTVWLLTRLKIVTNSSLKERLWKAAAILGVLTSVYPWLAATWQSNVAPMTRIEPVQLDRSQPARGQFDSVQLEGGQGGPGQIDGTSSNQITRSNPIHSPSIHQLRPPDFRPSVDHLASIDSTNNLTNRLPERPQDWQEGDANVDNQLTHASRREPLETVEFEHSTGISQPSVESLSNSTLAVEAPYPAPGPFKDANRESTHPRFIAEPAFRRTVILSVGCLTLIGGVTGLVRIANGYWALRKLIQTCQPMRAGLSRRLMADLLSPHDHCAGDVFGRTRGDRAKYCLCRILGVQVRIPQLVTWEGAAAPMACGVWRPRIILPSGCVEWM